MMKRLFGVKKEEKKVEAPPQPAFNLDEHVAKTNVKADSIENQLKPLDDEIRGLYAKYKTTAVASEKQYIKTRLSQKISKRNQLMGQLTRTQNHLAMVQKAQGNIDSIKDTAQMAQFMRETNKVMEGQMKTVDYDKLRDNIDDMNEMAAETDRMNEEINEGFQENVPDDLDEQLAGLEDQLKLQDVMNKNAPQKEQFNPLKN